MRLLGDLGQLGDGLWPRLANCKRSLNAVGKSHGEDVRDLGGKGNRIASTHRARAHRPDLSCRLSFISACLSCNKRTCDAGKLLCALPRTCSSKAPASRLAERGQDREQAVRLRRLSTRPGRFWHLERGDGAHAC